MARFPFSTVALTLVGLAIGDFALAAERTWSDKSGKFSVKAEFVSASDGKVWLKKSDGKVIAVPVDRLSAADQAFIKSAGDPSGSGGESEGAASDKDEPWKVGDQAYIRVKGQWQLAKLVAIGDGPGSARFEIALKTGSRRKMRVTEQRLRRFGKAGDHGLLLPGDKVEIVDRWKKDEVLTGTVVQVKGTRASVQVDGQGGQKTYYLTDLRAPGSQSGSSLAGRVKSAADSSRRPGQTRHPSDDLVYPDDPNLTEVNFAASQPVDIAGGQSTPSSVELSFAASTYPFKDMRPFPVKLIPKKDSWDKIGMVSVSQNGDAGAILRISRNKQIRLELAPLRKTRASTKLFGLLPNTSQLELSPGANWLLSLRAETFDRNPKIDLWRVKWLTEDRKAIESISHHISWSPNEPGREADALKVIRWLDDDTLLTVDKRSKAIVWQAESATPQYHLEFDANHVFPSGTSYAVVNRGKLGVSVLDLSTMRVAALIGKGVAIPGVPSVSPSGQWLLISGSNGIIEFWNLPKGEKLLQTRLAMPGDQAWGRSLKWSQEEPFILSGARPIDVQNWTLIKNSPLARRSTNGADWVVTEARNQPPLLNANRTLTTQANADVRPNTDANYVLKPGEGISLDVQVDGPIADATRARLTKMVEEQGFKVVENSRVVLRAKTSVETKSQEYGNSAFARKGDEGNFTVSYQVRSYALAVMLDGKALWSTTGAQSPGLPSMFTSEEKVRAAARKPIEPDARLFRRITLPETMIQASEG